MIIYNIFSKSIVNLSLKETMEFDIFSNILNEEYKGDHSLVLWETKDY